MNADQIPWGESAMGSRCQVRRSYITTILFSANHRALMSVYYLICTDTAALNVAYLDLHPSRRSYLSSSRPIRCLEWTGTGYDAGRHV